MKLYVHITNNFTTREQYECKLCSSRKFVTLNYLSVRACLHVDNIKKLRTYSDKSDGIIQDMLPW